MNGFFGKILKIDLSRRKTETEGPEKERQGKDSPVNPSEDHRYRNDELIQWSPK